MHKKAPTSKCSQRTDSAESAQLGQGRCGTPAGTSDSHSAERKETATPAEHDLLLWALANRLEPENGWFKALKLSRSDLAALSRRHQARFEQLRRMEVIGKLLAPEQLAVLLRARLAQMLLAAKGPKELAEALRVFEKLPSPPRNGADSAADAALDLELDEGELRETLAETRRVLKELEDDPAVRRLLGDAAGRKGEEPQC